MYQVTPVPAFDDNYIWVLSQQENPCCIVVDPGDAGPVLAFLQQQQKIPVAIFITHHHGDHTGGIAEIKQLFPDVRVIGPAMEYQAIPLLSETVTANQLITIEQLALTFSVIALPGHTLGHIAFYSAPVLFCGDTLFSAGCGRLFEGTPEQMWQSLQKLTALPDSTQIYCTHEYTLSNIKFALTVEPDNAALLEYAQLCQDLRMLKQPTLPAQLAKEKQINPFLRCNNKNLQEKWHKNTALALFSWLRTSKDQFKS